jgi:hypothetical protein
MKKRQPLQKKSSRILHSLQNNKCKFNNYETRSLLQITFLKHSLLNSTKLGNILLDVTCYHLARHARTHTNNTHTHTQTFEPFDFRAEFLTCTHSLLHLPTHSLTHSTAHNLP